MEEAFYNGRDYREKRIVISRFLTPHLYNKNILGYAKIARSGPKSMIRDIECFPNQQVFQ